MISNQSLHGRTDRRNARRGQTLVEYALIVAFIAVVAIGVLMALGGTVKSTMATVNTQLGSANTGGAARG